MSSRIALMLNGLYAIARKKSELNHQEKELIKSAAQTLEQALRKVEEQKAQMTDLQERIAIMMEGNRIQPGDARQMDMRDYEYRDEIRR